MSRRARTKAVIDPSGTTKTWYVMCSICGLVDWWVLRQTAKHQARAHRRIHRRLQRKARR